MVSASLARSLASQRATLNQRVADMRHRVPGFDTAAYAAFVSTGVDAVAVAVDAVNADATEHAVASACDIALDLVAHGLVGPNARQPWVEQVWTRLPSRVSALLARSPGETLGALTNAVVRLGGVPGVRVDEWIDAMASLGGRCESPDALKRLGAVCAWRAGMAHLRTPALEQAAMLDPALANAAVGAAGSPAWDTVHARLQAQRWWNPAHDATEGKGWIVGGFTGFGGPFAEPPEVRSNADGFIVASGGRHVLVLADAFGAVVLPASAPEYEHGATTPASIQPTPRGARMGARDVPFAAPMAGMRSVANKDSVALFSPWSHHIRVAPLTV